MFYFYYVRLRYYINDKYIEKDYFLTCFEIIDFLYNKQKKNSSMEIVYIKPKTYY